MAFRVGGPELIRNPSFNFPFHVALNTRKMQHCWTEGGKMSTLSASGFFSQRSILSYRCKTRTLYLFFCIFAILAHPSCMNYSPELVLRITSDASAWQCIDCKACIICNDSGDPVSCKFKILSAT